MTWDRRTETPTNIQIQVDGDQDGRILLVLHELAHVVADEVLDLESRLDDALEEDTIEAWAKALWEYVDADYRRRSWWRTKIGEKLSG